MNKTVYEIYAQAEHIKERLRKGESKHFMRCGKVNEQAITQMTEHALEVRGFGEQFRGNVFTDGREVKHERNN